MVLCGYLQEADGHQGQTVGADSPGEDLVQVPLQQELLQDEDQRRQDGVLLQHRDTHVRPEGLVHKVTGLCDRSHCRARGSNLFFFFSALLPSHFCVNGMATVWNYGKRKTSIWTAPSEEASRKWA